MTDSEKPDDANAVVLSFQNVLKRYKDTIIFFRKNGKENFYPQKGKETNSGVSSSSNTNKSALSSLNRNFALILSPSPRRYPNPVVRIEMAGRG